ncbi:MAG: toast rack family protein [Patescibacteria group bacterium]|nr:toast rack family protein [Patescibacteria group bacterium]
MYQDEQNSGNNHNNNNDNYNGQMPPKEQVREVHHYHYGRPGSSFARFFWGIFIIFIGLIFLAQAAGFISGSEVGMFFTRMWPVVIIFIGLGVIARGSWVGSLLSTIVALLLLSALAIVIFNVPIFGRQNISGLRNNVLDNANQDLVTQEISVDRLDAAQSAEISVNSGAAQIYVSGGSDRLVSGTLDSNFAHASVSSQLNGNTQIVEIKTEGSGLNFGRHINRLNLQLSTGTPLSLNLNSGASSLNLDFSGVNLQNFSLRAGASSAQIEFGDIAENSKADINAGASSVSLVLPKDVGAKINVSSALTGKNFSNFRQTGSNTYESENYNSAAKKMEINFNGGVSNVSVNWK